MAETREVTQHLAELILGKPLQDYVDEKRDARPRWSWELIADELAKDTDGKVAVSRETLRQWYGEAAEAAKASAS